MMKMKKRIITALIAVISVLSLCACTNGSKTDEPSTNEPNSKSQQQTSIPLEGESGYADYCVKIAESELKKLDFSSVQPVEVQNKAYAKAKTYTDSNGNTQYVGFNENGDGIFRSVQMYKDSKEYIYAEYKNSKLAVLSITADSSSTFFTFENGELIEYTVTNGKDGYNKEVRHYSKNGLTRIEIFDPDGNKLLDK
mgnify:FL=1